MSDGQRSIHDVLANAIEAEKGGVPIDWKQMCLQVINISTNHIAQLENMLPKDNEGPTDE